MMRSLIDIERAIRLMMEKRTLLCALLMVLPNLLLVARLWQVQGVQGPDLQRSAIRQTLRQMRVAPVRGRIFSQDGELLVGNQSSYDLVFHLSEMRRPGKLQKTVEYVLECANRYSISFNRPHELEERRLRNRLISRAAEPVIVFRGLSQVELAIVSEMSPGVPGVGIHIRNERTYPHPCLASHILGTTGWRVPQEGGRAEDYMQSFALAELVGTSGLEQVYEDQLSGEPGEEIIQVDYRGYYYGKCSEIEACNGNDLELSIDFRAQWYAEALMEGYHGAMVVVDVTTGGILALASSPTFDLSTLSKKRYAELAEDVENTPLLNRAIDGQYTPGSIFKPLVGMAALEQGEIRSDTLFECQGRYKFGNRYIDCSGRAVHGTIDIVDAIKMSCNGFFIHAGVQTGVDRMQGVLRSAGIGEPTEIDFEEHVFGVFPSRESLMKRKRRNWIPGDTALLSIGQGEILVTPLQAAMYCAAIANGGSLLKPYLVNCVRDDKGNVVRQAATVVRHRLQVSEENLTVIQSGMENAVSGYRGSARVMRDCGMTVAAKTGTAEVQGRDGKHKNTWIMCYGPLESPKYALVCLVERGESGGKTAGPLAMQFFKSWLPPPEPEAEEAE